MKQSQDLTEFYITYHEWLLDEAPEDNIYGFSREDGLCGNLRKYVYIFKKIDDAIIEELNNQFLIAGLYFVFPFGKIAYLEHKANKTQHLDHNRIRWVEEHLTTEVKETFEVH